MTDRELLELAAKAIGAVYYYDGLCEAMYCQGGGISKENWNPLYDDGDALRLAVKLALEVDISVSFTFINGPLEGQEEMATERHGDDPYAATRRAIVRAAAEIGKKMK